jgi:hypothetical protein
MIHFDFRVLQIPQTQLPLILLLTHRQSPSLQAVASKLHLLYFLIVDRRSIVISYMFGKPFELISYFF